MLAACVILGALWAIVVLALKHGRRDDTALVQRHLDNGTPLPPGEYRVTSTLTLDSLAQWSAAQGSKGTDRGHNRSRPDPDR
jgi:hypothetical protein